MKFEDQAKKFMEGADRAALEKVARSAAGERLAARVDADKIESAAREGDMKALSSLLKEILATPEGKTFAAEVQKAVKRDGR